MFIFFINFKVKQQYKASYLDKAVFDSFDRFNDNDEVQYKLLGLLESVSTFDTISNIDFRNSQQIYPLLAVANNIITRGNPTISSRYISSKLAFLSDGLTDQDFLDALHIVDTRPDHHLLYDDDLESNFERAFLNGYIPDDKKYLTQFFQHQRERRTLTNDAGDGGRVDFSFEEPYFTKVTKTTVYQKGKSLKERNAVIIEIDGKRYHNNLIDDIRDYETARFGHNTRRITERNSKGDTKDLIHYLSQTDYFRVVEDLLNKGFENVKDLQTYVLSPVAVARVQKVINQFLIVKYDEFLSSNKTEINVAVIERDVPCGYLAVNDLNMLYENLKGIENKGSFIPRIVASIFADPGFINERLQPQDCGFNFERVSGDFDLVIDIATLWRTGIFQADSDFENLPNAVIVRSSHFTEPNCSNEVYCSQRIDYRDLTIEIGNEQHQEIEEARPFAEYFLRNIFNKENFWKGQLPILNRALKNKTVIGLLPTGGGKSLTYQLAALLQPGITIIIDPIRSLMVDQYEGLMNIGIDKCDFINSILSREEKTFVQESILAKGKTQYLFCSPERMVIQEFRDALRRTNENGFYFSYCVIDEAHCVSEWGHDFRTPYLNLGENAIEYCKSIDGRDIPIFGLTATASFDVLADIERELKITRNDGNAIVRYENTVRDEINYIIYQISVNPEPGVQVNRQTIGERKLARTCTIINGINRPDRLILQYNNPDIYSEILSKTYRDYLPSAENATITERDFIESQTQRLLLRQNDDIPFHTSEEGKFNYGIIVFCPHKTSELGVDTFHEQLKNIPDNNVVFFKGSDDSLGKDGQDKLSFENMKLFKENKASVMVATKAFGMGIDKPNVRMTIHSNISSSIESFVQESGRAGRDGKTALSIILYTNQISRDREILERFHRRSFKGADKERSVIWELRNKIFFPNVTNLRLLNDRLNEEFDDDLTIKLGGITRGRDGHTDTDWTHIIFITNNHNETIGWIDIQSKIPSRFSSQNWVTIISA